MLIPKSYHGAPMSFSYEQRSIKDVAEQIWTKRDIIAMRLHNKRNAITL